MRVSRNPQPLSFSLSEEEEERGDSRVSRDVSRGAPSPRRSHGSSSERTAAARVPRSLARSFSLDADRRVLKCDTLALERVFKPTTTHFRATDDDRPPALSPGANSLSPPRPPHRRLQRSGPKAPTSADTVAAFRPNRQRRPKSPRRSLGLAFARHGSRRADLYS